MKNGWLAMESAKATSTPKAAPDLLTERRRSATVIRVSGASVEKSQRVGGMTVGSKNKYRSPEGISDYKSIDIFTSIAAAPEYREGHITQPHKQWDGYGKATEKQWHPVAVNHFACVSIIFHSISERKRTFIFNVNKNGNKQCDQFRYNRKYQLAATSCAVFLLACHRVTTANGRQIQAVARIFKLRFMRTKNKFVFHEKSRYKPFIK